MWKSSGNRMESEQSHVRICVTDTATCDLYYEGPAGGPAVGSRRFLGRVGRGDVVCVGGHPAHGTGEITSRPALPGQGSVRRDTSSPRVHEVNLRRWLEVTAAAVLKGPSPRRMRELKVGTLVTAEAHEAFSAGNELVWVRFAAGAGYLFSRRSPVSLLSGGPWPLAPHSWILVPNAATIEVLPWDELGRAEVLLPALRRHATLVIQMLHQDAAVRSAVEVRRLRTLNDNDFTRMDAACRELASVLVPEIRPTGRANPLESAVAAVAASVGGEIRPGSGGPDKRPMVRLRTYARANHLRMRRVALRGNWWCGDVGWILGSRKTAGDDAPRPVVLRPERHGPYVIWDPTDGSEKALDAQTAAQLAPFGYVFYPRMPSEAGRPRTLVALGLRGSGRDLWSLLLLGFLAGGLAMAGPVLAGKIYDYAIPEASNSQLGQIAVLLVSVSLAAAVLQFVRSLAILRVETRLDAALQTGIWDHLLSLPVRFFRNYTAGDLATRAAGMQQIRQLLSGAATGALLTGLFSIWYIGLLFYYDARLATWVSGALLLLSASTLALARIQLRHQRDAVHMQSRLSGLVLQLITGLSKLRVAGAEIRAFGRWADGFASQRRANVRARRTGNFLAAIQVVSPVLLLALVYGLVQLEGETRLSTGAFLAFQSALLSLAASVVSATNLFSAASAAVPHYEQLAPILSASREADEARADPGELSGDVEIRHVTFAYADDAPPVLDDVSVHIRAGSFVALVGPSGSGKSSLLRLLLGFESPDTGAIYFDGQEMSGLDLHALRRQFGVVLQEAGVLAGDVFTNIAGSSDATLEDAWEAARLAGLADDIRAMPMGMHTVIDQNGTTISGGQRQRLMIARAVVTRPRILLFDEATSALDNVTQRRVGESLARLQATRIVVAHRLSTIMGADVIYVLDRGRIVESGEFNSLMRRDGLFSRLARRQMIEPAAEERL